MTLGRINKIETFGSVDGPGVRFVVFTQGCPMRCLFCHNPETWDFKGDDGAFDISAEDLLKKALRYKSYWGKDGGITVSGGEPLMQMDFLIEFFELAKAAGVNTCIDTSGVNFVRTEPYFGKFKRLMASTDLLLVDLKIIDPEEHKKLTGHGIGTEMHEDPDIPNITWTCSATLTKLKSLSGFAMCLCRASATTTNTCTAPANLSIHCTM